jgi:hypothetical protein
MQLIARLVGSKKMKAIKENLTTLGKPYRTNDD